MTEDVVAYAILFGWLGFSWGRWWAERKARKTEDSGLRLLADMAIQISDKRKLVGSEMEISVSHQFDTASESYVLSLKAAPRTEPTAR